MTAETWIELIGYLGSTLVVVSMLMTSVMKLRIINTIGSVIFAIYALIIRSYPTALMNFCLVSINVYQMIRLRDTARQYELVKLSASDGYLSYFLKAYREDIHKFFPRFTADVEADTEAWLVNCDHTPAGVLLGKRVGEDMTVTLDYSTPAYRDCSVGTYLYDKLREAGIKRLICAADTSEHQEYLARMGFVKDEGTRSYTRRL